MLVHFFIITIMTTNRFLTIRSWALNPRLALIVLKKSKKLQELAMKAMKVKINFFRLPIMKEWRRKNRRNTIVVLLILVSHELIFQLKVNVEPSIAPYQLPCLVFSAPLTMFPAIESYWFLRGVLGFLWVLRYIWLLSALTSTNSSFPFRYYILGIHYLRKV